MKKLLKGLCALLLAASCVTSLPIAKAETVQAGSYESVYLDRTNWTGVAYSEIANRDKRLNWVTCQDFSLFNTAGDRLDRSNWSGTAFAKYAYNDDGFIEYNTSGASGSEYFSVSAMLDSNTDGSPNTGTLYHSGTNTWSKAELPFYIIIDLDTTVENGTKDFNSFILTNRGSGGNGVIKGYNFYINTTDSDISGTIAGEKIHKSFTPDSNWIKIASSDSSTGLAGGNELGGDGNTVNLEQTYTARQVMIEVTSVGGADDEVSRAGIAYLSADSIQGSGNDRFNVKEGMLSDNENYLYHSGSNPNGSYGYQKGYLPVDIIVNLGSAQTFDSFELTNRSGSNKDSINQYEFYVNKSDTDITPVFNSETSTVEFDSRWEKVAQGNLGEGIKNKVLFETVTARQVMIRVLKTHSNSNLNFITCKDFQLSKLELVEGNVDKVYSEGEVTATNITKNKVLDVSNDVNLFNRLESATVSVTAKMDTLNTVMSLFHIGDTSQDKNYLTFYLSSAGKIGYEHRTSASNLGNNVTIPSSINVKDVHRYTLKVDKEPSGKYVWAIYIDGTEIAHWTVNYCFTYDLFNGNANYMGFGGGRRVSSDSYLTNGYFTDAKISNYALSDEEIKNDAINSGAGMNALFNIAKGKNVTVHKLTDDQPDFDIQSNLGAVTDGFTSGNFAEVGYSSSNASNTKVGPLYVQVDLGAEYPIHEVKLFNYTGRSYGKLAITLDTDIDPSSQTVIFNSDNTGEKYGLGAGKDEIYDETSAGKTVSLNKVVKARYIRVYLAGRQGQLEAKYFDTSGKENHIHEIEAYTQLTSDVFNHITTDANASKVEPYSSYVFEGYYNTAGEAKTLTEWNAISEGNVMSGKYKRYVTPDVLSIKAQINPNAEGGAKIRFVTSVATLNPEQIGFEVSINDGEVKTITTTTVYEKINETINGVTHQTTAQSAFNNSASQYVGTFSIVNIPSTAYSSTFKIRAYWIPKGGSQADKVYGEYKEYKIQDLIDSFNAANPA